jgi:DnaK suppressor protein
MNQDEVKKLKKQLLKKQDELRVLKTSLKTSEATVMLDQNSVGRLSRMDAIQLQQMAIESARRNENNLLQIKAALIRIDNDDYGYCE